MYNKIDPDNVYKVNVQARIDDKIDDFLASVPPLVDVDISVWYLKTRWNPDAIDGNINGGYEDSHDDLETVGSSRMGEEDTAAIDDDLEEELDLR